MATDIGTFEPKQPTVVLIHGWISHPIIMKPLEWRLQHEGFATRNWGYPSLRGNIEEHAAAFADLLHSINEAAIEQPFHIVTHSMGSIVTRWVLHQHQYKNLGRIVMLCPPNRGSHMARRVSSLLRGSLRTLDQISDRSDSFVNQLPTSIGHEVGIVIARGDRVIQEDATRLDDVQEYAAVPGMHNAVLFKRSVVELCVRFLRTGKFTS